MKKERGKEEPRGAKSVTAPATVGGELSVKTTEAQGFGKGQIALIRKSGDLPSYTQQNRRRARGGHIDRPYGPCPIALLASVSGPHLRAFIYLISASYVSNGKFSALADGLVSSAPCRAVAVRLEASGDGFWRALDQLALEGAREIELRPIGLPFSQSLENWIPKASGSWLDRFEGIPPDVYVAQLQQTDRETIKLSASPPPVPHRCAAQTRHSSQAQWAHCGEAKDPEQFPGSGHSTLPDLPWQCCTSLKRQRSAKTALCKVGVRQACYISERPIADVALGFEMLLPQPALWTFVMFAKSSDDQTHG